MSESHAILVLGMHRSGTSALARTLALAGAGLPATLVPPTPGDNDLGYWESMQIVQFHERLFRKLGTAMLEPTPTEESWFASPDAQVEVETLARLLEAEWGDHPCWVVKEPRACRFIPIWREALESIGRRAVVVVPLREPAEVASSLSRRDGFPRPVAERLWALHAGAAERRTRGIPRVFSTYHELLDDWRSVVDRVAALLPAGMLDPARDAASIDTFLSRSLRHHAVDGDPPADPAIRALRDRLLGAARERREPSAVAIDAAWDSIFGSAVRRPVPVATA